MRVQSTTPAAAPKTVKAPAKAAAPSKAAAPKMDLDAMDFGRAKTTPAQIEAAKKAVVALAQTPSIPLKNSEKTAWLSAAKAKQAAADKAIEVLSDANFWDKAISNDEIDALHDAVRDHADKIERCEVRAGLKPMPKPANPFRPLGEYTGSLNNLPNNIFGALGKAFGVMVTIPMDIVDGVTRPIQAVLWPVAWGWRGVQKAGNAIGIG